MASKNSPSTLPTRQPAVTLENQGPEYAFRVAETDVPSFEPHEVLVRLEVTGICGTDIGLAAGLLGQIHSSRILGHEGVGSVAAVGSNVSSDIKVGQRVGVGWIRDACGACHVCISGEGETYCVKKTFSGMHVPGTLSRYTVVPERYLTLLPDDLAPEVMAPIMCAGVTAYKAIKSAHVIPGSWMLVSGGAGAVGSLAVQYARAMGYRVIAIDGGEKMKGYCLEAGAEVYIDFETEDIKQVVEKVTQGKLCSSALVCIGAPAAYKTALTCLGYFGVLVCVGIPPPGGEFPLHPLRLIDSGIRVVGSLVGSRGDIAEAMEFVRRGVVKPKVILVEMSEVNTYARKISGLGGKLVIKL